MKIVSARAISYLFGIVLVALLSACGGGGSPASTATPTTPSTPPAPVAAALNLSASATSVKSDNSDSTTITTTVLNASNAAVPGVTVTFAADTGILSNSSVVSDASGQAKVTFSSGGGIGGNRTATITATSGSVSSQIPITITGTTIDLVSNTTALTIGGGSATLTVTVKNAGGVAIANVPVSFSSTGVGGATISPASTTTNASGQVAAQIAGATAGVGTVTVSAAGVTRTVNYSIAGASAFGISSTQPASTNKIVALTLAPPPSSTTTLVVNVTAPIGTTVVFVSTSGKWASTNTARGSRPSTAGAVSDALTVSAAGVASIQVFDASNPNTADSLTASITSAVASAAKITAQAVPTVVAPSLGGTAGVSSLIATVTDGNNQPVGGATVAFEILNPTGGGETIAPVVAQTLTIASGTQALGQAKATFTAGSLPSGAPGVKIRATVVEAPGVQTGNGTSGNDASIVIGGTAGSIAIGRATVIQDAANSTAYVLPMSVLVADSNGNPVANTTVSLSAWPLAFAPGAACSPGSFYYNEDIDENLNIDLVNEDGVRKPYPNGLTTGGTKDMQATPPNSASGTLPSTVTTNASGLATFNLTYTKSNALFILARIRASTLVQGTETVGETRFQLPALLSDIGPPCLLPASSYQF